MLFKSALGLLVGFAVACSVGSSVNDTLSTVTRDFLLCRHCGFNIAPAAFVVNLRSPAAESFVNQTLFGLNNVEVQALRNPLGIQFNVVTAKGGTCIGVGNKWQIEHSWYPAHGWKLCQCSHCSKQIGWVFEPLSSASSDRVYASLKGFYAFILDNIISEAYDKIMADHLTDEQKQFLAICEEQFKNRYTEYDEDYKAFAETPPPILPDNFESRGSSYNRSPRYDRGSSYDHRSSYDRGSSYDHGSSYDRSSEYTRGSSYEKYGRNERQEYGRNSSHSTNRSYHHLNYDENKRRIDRSGPEN